MANICEIKMCQGHCYHHSDHSSNFKGRFFNWWWSSSCSSEVNYFLSGVLKDKVVGPQDLGCFCLVNQFLNICCFAQVGLTVIYVTPFCLNSS